MWDHRDGRSKSSTHLLRCALFIHSFPAIPPPTPTPRMKTETTTGVGYIRIFPLIYNITPLALLGYISWARSGSAHAPGLIHNSTYSRIYCHSQSPDSRFSIPDLLFIIHYSPIPIYFRQAPSYHAMRISTCTIPTNSTQLNQLISPSTYTSTYTSTAPFTCPSTSLRSGELLSGSCGCGLEIGLVDDDEYAADIFI